MSLRLYDTAAEPVHMSNNMIVCKSRDKQTVFRCTVRVVNDVGDLVVNGATVTSSNALDTCELSTTSPRVCAIAYLMNECEHLLNEQ
jgi:hypothetical protein